MMSDQARSFRFDSADPGLTGDVMATFASRWQATIGESIPLPAFDSRPFRGRSWAGWVREVSMTTMRLETSMRTSALPQRGEDIVRLYAIRRGHWHLDDPHGGGSRTLVPGQFLLQHMRTTTHFETSADLLATIVMLPTATVNPVLGEHVLSGSTRSPELRLLLAHVDMVQRTLDDLPEAAVRAADSTLIELTKAVALGRFDDQESTLVASLAGAARRLADQRLTDADLSTSTLARELHVSPRTLQRAFAADGEPVSAYIRRRRLEEAFGVLASGSARLSVADMAAHWHFSDSSHFIRAFRERYGQTPTDVAGGYPAS